MRTQTPVIIRFIHNELVFVRYGTTDKTIGSIGVSLII